MLRRFVRQLVANPSKVTSEAYPFALQSHSLIAQRLAGDYHHRPEQRNHSRLVQKRFYSSHHQSQNNGQKRLFPTIDGTLLGLIATTATGSLIFAYMMKDYLGPRESEILQPSIDLKKDSHHGHIVDSTDYECIGPKPSGELSGCVMRHRTSNKTYLMKGAKSKDTLVKEFIISNFLAMLHPGVQPQSLIMEEKHLDGNARLYTLSEIYPNSMDLKAFISQPDYAQKIAEKPIRGFEVALASDLLFAKQADMKFANYVIIERDDAFFVVSIDHEMTGKGVHAKRMFVDDIQSLFSHVRDTNNLISVNDNDPEEFANSENAREFMHLAMAHMKYENIQEFYNIVAQANINEMEQLIQDIDTQDGIITLAEGQKYLGELRGVVDAARIRCVAASANKNVKQEMEEYPRTASKRV